MTTPTPPTRTDVLSELWLDFNQVKEISKAVKEHPEQLVPELRCQIYIYQVRSQIGKTIISGLKDEELEIRVKDLEEKLKNGVLIPRNE